MVRGLLPRSEAISDDDWRLVESVVRPDVWTLGGGLVTRLRGLPTGQPICTVLFNLYLGELDDCLASVPGAFYARYGDDIVFAHPDADVAQAAEGVIDSTLARLGLSGNREKRRTIYLTAPGRPSPAWPEARGSSSVQFLGAAIEADGSVALSRKNARRLLRDVTARARRTAVAAGGANADETGRVVCAVVNHVLEPEAHAFQQPWATLLGRAVTDRRQLAQLDYLLARGVIAAVTGDTGVRAFRHTPYRTVRDEWGLRSLLHARNSYRPGALR
jgi:hypothetical protein